MSNTPRPNRIELNYTIEASAVVWLRSLPEDELGPSIRMVEDIQTAVIATATSFSFSEIVVRDRTELLDALHLLAERCVSGFRPILHFDCHGNREAGILLAPSGDIMSWNELADALSEINVATQNNLCCVFGVCFGLTLSQSLDLLKPTPYFLTIAPENEVLVGVLEDHFPCFYKELFRTKDISDAFDAHLAQHFKCYHATKLIFTSLVEFHAINLIGKGLREFRENMVSLVNNLSKDGVISEQQLANTRKVAKETLRPNQFFFDFIVEQCLIGRDPGFGLPEIVQHARVRRQKMDQEKNAQDKRAKAGRLPRAKPV
ncbi:hypothetical protein [Acetobacter sp. KSO5]|uniref:hypothetical protein n=1 Tax=Acetobacter sp. KSO5 TaxID=3373674 RepID=UPI00376EAA50